MNTTQTKFKIKPATKKEIAAMYEVSPRSLYTQLKPFEDIIGKKIGRYYTVNQVKTIIDKLGIPPSFQE
jgi:transposase